MPTYILYHKNCLDGFGAALAAYTVFAGEATYIPVDYQRDPPEMPAGSQVYILDFAYPRPVMEALLERHHRVILLDHHQTAAEELLGLRGTLFDLNRSGATLAWQYFHPDEPLPRLFRYLQDRDLWRWEYGRTAPITAALGAIGFDSLADWLPYLNEDNLSELETMGAAILKANHQMVKQLVSESYLGILPGRQQPMPMANTSVLVSETCHALLNEGRYRTYPMAAAWFQGSDRVYYSLRSRQGFDCSEIARGYGGGGHPQASGFSGQELPQKFG